MKTTVELPDPLLARAKALARRQQRTLRDLIEAGLRTVLAEEERRNRFVLRDASVGGEGLQEGFTHDDWGKILDASYGDRSGEP
jgi:predicted transcriptional regulator